MKQKNKVDLFLDSGAFSAYTQNTEIDIQEYINFIKQHEKVITVYANLDVIGNSKKTLKNQKIMEKAGLNPLPVYHLGDPVKYLHYYIKNHDYISIGGLAGRQASMARRVAFLDKCFNIVCDTPDRLPKVKVHGFGMTSLKLMFRYPWYSVDSTSWVVAGRVGMVFIPRYKQGDWIYTSDALKISVSNKSPDLKTKEHFDNFSKKSKQIILDYLNEKGYKIGKSEFKEEPLNYELKENEKWAEKKPTDKDTRKVEIIVEEGISNKYQLRDELNIIYFQDLEKQMKKYPWPFKNNNNNKLF